MFDTKLLDTQYDPQEQLLIALGVHPDQQDAKAKVAEALAGGSPKPDAATPAPSAPVTAASFPDTPTTMASSSPIAPIARPNGPKPVMLPEQRLAADQAELDRLKNSPDASGKIPAGGASGIAQIHSPFLRTIARVGDIAGRVMFPAIERQIPGTEGHHQELVNTAAGEVANDLGTQEKQAQTAHVKAETQALEDKPGAKPVFEKTLDGSIVQLHTDPNGHTTAEVVYHGDSANPKDPFQLWHQQNPQGKVEDFLKLQQDNKPDTGTQLKQRARQLEQNLAAGTITQDERNELATIQREAKIQGVGSEAIAQVGRPPVPAEYPKGYEDPEYKKADAAWGKAVEGVKNREAAAAGASRGEGFGAGRRIAVIDPRDGHVKIMSAGTAELLGAAPAGEGTKLMSKEAQFNEMHVAAQKAKEAITGLDRDFTAAQIAKLTLAFSHDDAGVVKNEVDSILGTQELTPAQQDFVIWINQLNERAMSLRNIAGMGQGSQDLRSAIKATLPGLKSGSKEMALKQLDAFNNQVNLLEKGVPKINTGGEHKKAAPSTLTPEQQKRDQRFGVVYE